MSAVKQILAFRHTIAMVSTPDLKKETEYAKAGSKIYYEGFLANKQRKAGQADIIVEEDTSFSAAKKYMCFGKTAVLNFANPKTPGGDVKSGAMAQEECLCRSSNLYPCLCAEHVYQDYYKYHRKLRSYWYSDRLIYTRGVIVIKNDDPIPQMLDSREWFYVDVITCAAPYIGWRKYVNKQHLKEVLKSRIKNIFEAAIDNGVQVMILGAFGCGAFKNPPETVAAAFREVMEENEYASQFTKIVFAIKRSSKSVCPNLTAFQREFQKISLPF